MSAPIHIPPPSWCSGPSCPRSLPLLLRWFPCRDLGLERSDSLCGLIFHIPLSSHTNCASANPPIASPHPLSSPCCHLYTTSRRSSPAPPSTPAAASESTSIHALAAVLLLNAAPATPERNHGLTDARSLAQGLLLFVVEAGLPPTGDCKLQPPAPITPRARQPLLLPPIHDRTRLASSLVRQNGQSTQRP